MCRNSGRGLKTIGAGLLLLLVICSLSFSQDQESNVSSMTTEAIVLELISITERQAARLTEAERLLNEQTQTLMSLRQQLTESSESYTQLETITNEQSNYSRSLESEVGTLTTQRTWLLWGLAGSLIAGLVGWLL